MGSSTGLSDVGGQRLVTPPIRGRTAELKVIGSLVAAVAQGRGGVLLIEGPPGIGKSRLLTEVLAMADKCGVRTLFGEAFEYQQAVPFFSLFMATLRADPPVGDADAMRRLGVSADLRYWVVHELADAIHAAAAETPLVIVLEDVHWADNGTLLALRSLATARPDAAVLWVLTVRTGAGGPALQETLSVLHRANAAIVRVAAMSPDAVADMVCDAVRAVSTHSTATSGRAVASDRSANNVPLSAQWISSNMIASGVWAAAASIASARSCTTQYRRSAEPPILRSASASPTGGSARRVAMNSEKNGTVS